MYWRKNNRFAYKDFTDDVKEAVRFLNEVLDEGQDLHPLKEQRETVSKLRQIGLGFMGLGDLFIQARVRYGSPESIELCHKIGYRMIFAALQESVELAKEKGSFDNCKPKLIIKSKFYKENVDKNPYYSKEEKKELTESILKYGLRNSQLLTCAPTGTTSTIFNVSGGIEPIFALRFTRTTKSIYNEDRTYDVYPRGVQYFLDKKGYNSLDEVEEFPDYLVTSRDIDWKDRIDVQAAWQKHIDASISATINLPEETTVEDIEGLYMYSHEAGLKGTTVFRENCKRIAILNDSFKKKDDKKEPEGTAKIDNSIDELYEFIEDFFDDICKKYGSTYTIFSSRENKLEELKIIKSIVDIEYVFNKNIGDIGDPGDICGCDLNPNNYDKKDKYPDCIINTENLKAIKGDTGTSIGDPKGISDIGIYIEAIKDKFKGNFSNILTRADFSSALHGTTYYKRVACGHIYITVNRFQGRPVEVFMQSSKSGGCSANTEALGRMASTMLRAGIDPDIVVDSVSGVKCAACSAIKGKGEQIDGLSCSDVMGRVIKEEYDKYKNGEYDNEIREWLNTASYEEKWELIHSNTSNLKKVTDDLHCSALDCPHRSECSNDHHWMGCCGPDDPGAPGEPGDPGIYKLEWNYKEHSVQENIDNYVCPDCGAYLTISEGCLKCINCGFSKC